MEAAWFSEGSEGRITCLLCPHRCTLAEGAFGLCKVRRNHGGRLDLPLAGRLSSAAVDPIEKKPLYRFLPGSTVYSVGFFGCTMRCPFCQNWEISQRSVPAVHFVPAAELVASALNSGCPSIAFTYSEPTVHYEYVLEAALLARQAGLRTVLVTNGLLNAEPAARLLSAIDAVNLDIKCFSDSVYRKALGGDLATVLDFARAAARTSWLEATTLVVPGLEDWESAVAGISSFLAELSPHLPYHLSAYHPAYKYEAPATEPALLLKLGELAARKLDSVYLGNLAGETSIDRCGSCGAKLVERRGYRVSLGPLAKRDGTEGGALEQGKAVCSSCGHEEFYVL